MTRKSGEQLPTTYGNTRQLFRPSSAVYTMISTAGDRTGDLRLQSRNSTTEPRVYVVHTCHQIN